MLLGYEEALWPKELKISHASQILTNGSIFFLSYLITIVAKGQLISKQNCGAITFPKKRT